MFILFVIGGMIFAFATALLIVRIHFIKTGIITEATVIDRTIIEAKSSDDSDSMLVTFQFYLQNNEAATYKDEFADIHRWNIGDKATIVYKTRDAQLNDPYYVVLLTYWDSFGVVTVLFSAALLMTLIAGGYYWAEHFFETLTEH